MSRAACCFEQEVIMAAKRLNSVNALVEKNVAFATRMARTFYRQRMNSGIELEDFIGAARLGLCDAAKRFDPRRGQRFETFVYFRIKGAMYDLLQRSAGIPRSQFVRLVAKSDNEDEQEDTTLPFRLANDPRELISLTTLIEDFGFKLHKSREASAVELSYADAESPESLLVLKSLREQMQELLSRLPDRQREIIERRYYADQTFDEMKDSLGGVSKSWVSRLHSRAINNLKEMIYLEARHV